jgi:hypothetical protein
MSAEPLALTFTLRATEVGKNEAFSRQILTLSTYNTIAEEETKTYLQVNELEGRSKDSSTLQRIHDFASQDCRPGA